MFQKSAAKDLQSKPTNATKLFSNDCRFLAETVLRLVQPALSTALRIHRFAHAAVTRLSNRRGPISQIASTWIQCRTWF